jgi:hypothetical protein
MIPQHYYMNKSLTQKSGFKTSTFSIEDTGLLVQTKSKQNSSELHYPFEQIKTNRATGLDHNKALLTLAIIFGAIALLVFIMSFTDTTIEWIAAPIWATISAVLFVIYFRTRQRKFYLQTTENKIIALVVTKNTFDAVNNFIEQLMMERNLYLVSKYAQLSRNLEYSQQLDTLNWLLNNRAFSKEKYDGKVQELNALFNSHLTNKPIGFSANN